MSTDVAETALTKAIRMARA